MLICFCVSSLWTFLSHALIEVAEIPVMFTASIEISSISLLLRVIQTWSQSQVKHMALFVFSESARQVKQVNWAILIYNKNRCVVQSKLQSSSSLTWGIFNFDVKIILCCKKGMQLIDNKRSNIFLKILRNRCDY